MKKVLRVIKLVVINLAITLLLIETGSLILYFAKTREVFYLRDRSRVQQTLKGFGEPAGPQPTQTPDMTTTDYELHPYFGFIHKVGLPGLPFKRTNKNQYLVGIFGGSVAMDYYQHDILEGLLFKALKGLPQLRDKRIVLLCFAHESYKQPQQLMVLNYFLSTGQELDLAINVDGFNETAVAYANAREGFDLTLPSGYMLYPLMALANRDPASRELSLAVEITALKQKVRAELQKLNDCYFAASYALHWGKAQYFSLQYQRRFHEFNSLPRNTESLQNDALHRQVRPATDAEIMERLAKIWSESTLMMNQLFAARNIPYFHFIQPNQYYKTQKHFKDEEAKIALAQSAQYGEPVSKGYPLILGRIGELRAAGVKVFSAVNVFDGFEETVYIDPCCHYNNRGNYILAQYIAETVATNLKAEMERQSPKPKD